MPRCRMLLVFALKMSGKPLHFVQRGRILLRCGSAFALSLPSLGVSSLDLGRLFSPAALFFWKVLLHSGMREAQTRNLEVVDASFLVRAWRAPRNDDATPPPPGTARYRR